MNSASHVNLIGLDPAAIRAYFARLGEKPFRAPQVMQWIHQHGVADFDAMSNLPKALRERLKDEAVIAVPEIAEDHIAHDGTRKWLLRLSDGQCIETVFIPVANRALGRDPQSSHSGRERIITNVVMMGMGEPLLNFDNVVSAMRIMLDDFAYGLSRRRVTLSTAGVVPMLARLREECPVSLAVSLHAPNDVLRNELVPLNRKHHIAELMDACRAYVDGDGSRRVTFEYVMLAGVNDSHAHASELTRVLRGIPCKVNLIPFNPFKGSQYVRSDRATIDTFRDVLMQANIMTVTRKTRGDDIDAACGQLAGQVNDRTPRSARLRAQSSREVRFHA